eukprot:gene12575-6395_t
MFGLKKIQLKNFQRFYSSKQETIELLLKQKLNPIHMDVMDISGGCGSMFQIDVVSPEFEGKSILQQHKLVKQILSDEIKEMHGLTLKTKTPKKYNEKKDEEYL